MIEVLEGGWPWLPLLPFGLIWAWRWRQSRWGRWSLTCLATLGGAILPLRTQLPGTATRSGCPLLSSVLRCSLGWWSVLFIEFTWHPKAPWRWLLLRLPCSGAGSDCCSCCFGWAASAASAAALRLTAAWRLFWASAGVGGWWLRSGAPQRRRLGVICLSCGNVAALALLFLPLWLWELNETWPVQPVAALARANPGSEIKLKGSTNVPANWYAEQRIQRFTDGGGRRLSDKPQEGCITEGQAGRWTGQLPVT